MIFRSGIACSLTLLAMLPLAAAQRPRVLLVTGASDEPYHQWRDTSAAIRDILGARFEVNTVEEPRGITPESLGGYTTVILNYNGPRFPRAAESALENYVRGGGGLVAFHLCAYGTFFGMEFRGGKWQAGPTPGWAEYARMIGASWAPEKIGHARRWSFTVDWKDTEHPVARGLPKSWVANDELYHRLTLAPTARVLADAFSPADIGGTGNREPMAWTNAYGKGRVFFTTLGHDTMAFYRAGMQHTFARGVEWAATGAVAEPHQAAAPVRLLVVTGGHGYPEAEFYDMLNSLGPAVRWRHATSQAEAFGGDRPLESRYDVVLLHDMHDTTSEALRAKLKSFVEGGKGVISLHHAIVDYTDWPWWHQEVIGGKYFVKPNEGHAASHYREDAEFLVTPVKGKSSHPVMRGVGPLLVDDELYRGMWHSPKIEVLMETAHPENDRPVVYVGPHPRARALYIQLGHSAHTMRDPGFRRLMRNAVEWTARRTGQE
jgi:type 1 glutamine amidotransferase